MVKRAVQLTLLAIVSLSVSCGPGDDVSTDRAGGGPNGASDKSASKKEAEQKKSDKKQGVKKKNGKQKRNNSPSGKKKSDKKKSDKKKSDKRNGGKTAEESPLPSDHGYPNVVMLLIDTLRKDHLGCYGYHRNTSPHIDRLAENGMLFQNAVSQAPWTPPSVAALMTAQYPGQTGVGAAPDAYGVKHGGSVPALSKKAVTLAEAFRRFGYRTAAVSSNMYVTRKFGMLQGFEKRYSRTRDSGRADWVTQKAMKWVLRHLADRRGEPFFLYMHYMDVHDSHAGAAFRELFYDDALRRAGSIADRGFRSGLGLDTPEFALWRQRAVARYDASIAFVDNYIGDFISFSKREKFYKDTLFVVLSDHGEAFWDHAEVERTRLPNPRERYGVGHGHTLFAELLEVPLIFHGAEIPSMRVERLVRLIDTAPSILGYADLPKGQFLQEGRDVLFPELLQDADAVAFSEGIAYGSEMKSIQTDRYKLIRGRRGTFFFDKQRDPAEQEELGDRFPDVRASLIRQLNEMIRKTSRDAVEIHPVELDEETAEVLRTLGYLD